MRAALSARMLAAAETIQELNSLYQFGDHCPWEPTTLRTESLVVADEEREAYA